MSKELRKELTERLADLKLKQAAELASLSPSQTYLDDIAVTISYIEKRLKG
jgi:hypothetical protein